LYAWAVSALAFVRRYSLAIFFLLTFALFWLVVPQANALQVGLIASFAPSAVALLLTALIGGGPALRALAGKLGVWRVGWVWYAAAVGIPLAASLAVLIASSLLGGAPAAQLGPAPILFAIIYVLALGEELGWRGFALPRLLARLPALPVALILGLVHALYHLPLWYAPGFPAPSYSFASFVVASLAFGILWTWLYQHTHGSVLIALLFHGSINAAGNVFFGGVPPALLTWLMPLAFGLAALAVLALAGPELTRQPTAAG
jgi:membrane protease YdiL (CAAX protease family)